MGINTEGVYLAATDPASQVTVRELIEEYWLQRGAARDDRNPLRIPALALKQTGRVGYAISPSTDGWIAVAGSDGVTADLARHLAGQTGAAVCRYCVVNAVNDASVEFMNWPDHPGVRAADVQGFVEETFPFPLLYYRYLLSLPTATLQSFTTIGFENAGGVSCQEGPLDAVWRCAEQGDAAGFLAAIADLDSPSREGVLESLDLAAKDERHVLRFCLEEMEEDLAGEILPTAIKKTANADDDELFQICLDRASIATGAAMLWRGVGYIHDPRRALLALERLADCAPAKACELAVYPLCHRELLSVERLQAWSKRIRDNDIQDPELEHRMMSLCVKLGEYARGVEHAERALAYGLPLDELRYQPFPKGPHRVLHHDHKALTREPRYRELIRKHSPPPEREAPDAPVRVVHAKFGEGVILEDLGDQIVVEFDGAGRKRILRRFVELVR